MSFFWESREGAVGTGEGRTRDISIAGVFILTAEFVPEGSMARMEVNLAPLHPTGQRIHLRAQGRVVRTEDVGFAAMANMSLRAGSNEVEGSKNGATMVRRGKKRTEAVLRSWRA